MLKTKKKKNRKRERCLVVSGVLGVFFLSFLLPLILIQMHSTSLYIYLHSIYLIYTIFIIESSFFCPLSYIGLPRAHFISFVDINRIIHYRIARLYMAERLSYT